MTHVTRPAPACYHDFMNFRVTTALACIIWLVACSTEDSPATDPSQEIRSPAVEASSLPRLTSGPGDSAWLSWVESSQDGLSKLRLARYDQGRWAGSRTIAEGTQWFVNWADFPSVIVTGDGRMLAHWLVKSASAPYAYDVVMALSNDGGDNWGQSFSPHDDGTPTEHGFVSLYDLGADFGAVWLDGRNMQANTTDVSGHGHGGMTLRSARISADGRVSAGKEVDGLTCDCCQTGAAVTDTGPVVVYRDRTEDEIRDIYIVSYRQGEWTAPRRVAGDDWRIAACPVNGPVVEAAGSRVVVAWFTDIGGPVIRAAFSEDAGDTFSEPVEISRDRPLGRTDLALLEDGSAIVSWLAGSADGGEIRYRRITGSGTLGRSMMLARTSDARSSGFPQMVVTDGSLIFAWTDVGPPSNIRSARVGIPGD